MACGLTAGRRGEQKPGISKYPQLRWARIGWLDLQNSHSTITPATYLLVVPRLLPDFSRRRRKVVTPFSDSKIEFSFGIGGQFFGRLRVPSVGLKYTCKFLARS